MKKHSLQISIAVIFLMVLGMGMVASQMDPDRKNKIFRTARRSVRRVRRATDIWYI